MGCLLLEPMEGLVIKNTGSDYIVRSPQGDFPCKVKGNFRIRGIKSTNPVAVGDRVVFDPDGGYITDVCDRRNYIVRRPTNLSKQLHIIAANIDQSLLIVTVKEPVTATTFIDRFLASSEAYGIPAVIVFNKTDLLDSEELEYLNALEYLYRSIGYGTLRLSALHGDGLSSLRALLNGKISLLSGNSGVGKSTIINGILPGANARTGDISSSHHKGMHTTTFSEMYELDHGTYIIDTPGIKGFGTVNMAADEISHYFPEIFRTGRNCRFSNCTHTGEPGCAVLAALENHLIARSRYDSYISMRSDIDESKYR